MYGTIDKKTELEDERRQQHLNQTSQTSNGQGPNSRATLEQETVRRKKIYSHCHIQSANRDHNAELESRQKVDKSARRRLIIASITCLVFMVAEIVGGVLSNSLAIATDAAHLLTDFASFMISLFAIWLSSRPASRKMSFGWSRAEVIGALLSVLMIWLVTGFLVYMAIERLRTGKIEIDSFVMVVTASGGLLVNIIMALVLSVGDHHHFHSHGGHSHGNSHSHHKEIDNHSHLDHLNEDDDNLSSEHIGHEHQQENHSVSIDCSMKEGLTTDTPIDVSQQVAKKHKKTKKQCQGNETSGRVKGNINVRAAFIHVIGDFLQSLGVLIAALVIHFEPSYAFVDPICTFLFSFIVLVTTISIIRDATNVLMEGIPDGINFIEVHEKLQSLPNVIRVHNLRIWSLSLDKIAISTHLVIDTSKTTSAQALRRAIDSLKNNYNFSEMTIQIEEYREDMKDCEHCQDEQGLPDIVVDNEPTVSNRAIA